MLAGFFVVFFVEFADELLEDRPHRVVVDAFGAEVNIGVEKLADERAEGIGL